MNNKIWISFWILFYLVGLVYSKTMLTISMIALLVSLFITFERKSGISFSLKVPNMILVRAFSRDLGFLTISLIFLCCALTLPYSEWEGWVHFTWRKLPFLFMPVVFYVLYRFSVWETMRFYLIFVLILFASTFPVLWSYIFQHQEIIESIKVGKSFTTPIDHIRYSLFLSYAVVILVLILFRFSPKCRHIFGTAKYNTLLRSVLIVILVYLVVFIHLLAARSGIVILYLNVIVLLVYYIVGTRKYVVGIGVLTLMFLLPIMAYEVFPSFKEKIKYTMEDFKMSRQQKEYAYSDGERKRSLIVGWKLFEDNPIFGVGWGNLYKYYDNEFEKQYLYNPPTRLPHNQYLTTAAGSGVVGLAMFLLGTFVPLFYRKAWKNPFLLTVIVLIAISYLVENTIERQYAIAFYLIFLLIGLKNRDQDIEMISEK